MKAGREPGTGMRAWLVRAPLLLLLAALVAVRLADFGDRGMRNAFTALLALALGGTGALVLATRRGLPLRVRMAILGTGLATLLVAGVLVRVEGLDGELRPVLSWRFGARAPTAAEPPPAEGGSRPGPPAADDWPGFLGPRRDNTAPGVRLARDWQAHPPRLLWRHPIGTGWSAFALAGGWAFTLEQDANGQHATARTASDGRRVWSTRLDDSFEHPLGGEGPAATPTVELENGGDGSLWVLTSHGILACLDAVDGSVRWSHDLVAEFGSSRELEAERAPYGRTNSPLLDGDLVIVPAGGDPEKGGAGLVAWEKRTGERRWVGPARPFSCSSPTLATLAGVPQILVLNEATVSAHAPDDGRLLWEHPWPGRTYADPNVSQPVAIAPDRVLLSKGYGSGGALLALERGADGGFGVREEWHAPLLLRTKFTNVVLHAGHAYALDDGMLECVELTRGEKRWKEGRYGHGQLLLVGELLLLCSEEGELVLLEASPERPDAVLARVQALAGKSWANPALAAHTVYLRNATECAAWELATEP